MRTSVTVHVRTCLECLDAVDSRALRMQKRDLQKQGVWNSDPIEKLHVLIAMCA
jgi:hypothetical protein